MGKVLIHLNYVFVFQLAQSFRLLLHQVSVSLPVFLPKVHELYRNLRPGHAVSHQVNRAKAPRAKLLYKLQLFKPNLEAVVLPKAKEKLVSRFQGLDAIIIAEFDTVYVKQSHLRLRCPIVEVLMADFL